MEIIIDKLKSMIRKAIFMMALCLCGQMQVNAATSDDGTDDFVPFGINEDMLRQIEPTYLKEVAVPSAWSSNWFVGVSGGTSAFVGKPFGDGNLFDRMKPSLALSAGKWFTPEIGGRLSFLGFQFKDADKSVRDYKMVHADFLWNMTSSFTTGHASKQRWGFIPYVGCGIVHNEDNGKSPFVINYGVIGQYRITKRLAVNMELGGATTLRDFDGKGASNKFGDNLFTLSAGLTFNIGKVGWKKVVDAAPYINQNKWLADYANDLLARNQKLSKVHAEDANAIAEMRKILEIEGLLNAYSDRLAYCADSTECRIYPKNDYSGLNSLRARLAHKDWNGMGKPKTSHSLEYSFSVSDSVSWNKYVAGMTGGNKCIGSPVFFFFKIGTTQLVDTSQIVNLDELARVAKAYHLKVSVVGAADSATGSDGINNPLSKSRADYITQQLMARGIDKSTIISKSEGGIDEYSPVAANRHTAVRLFVQ